MKNVKLICKYLVFFTLFSFFAVSSFCQDDKAAGFEKTYKLNADGKLAFSLYDADLRVNIWDKSEVSLSGEIIITGGKTNDREMLIAAFKEPETSGGLNALYIDTKFWKSNVTIGSLNRISLKNGNKVSVRSFKVSYTLWIPENTELTLNSKYSDVEIADFAGTFFLDLYDTDIRTGDFGDNSTFNGKYSSFITGNGKNASFDIYDCKVNAGNLADVIIVTKYSDLSFAGINQAEIQSYDDDFDIKSVTGINATAKYSLFLLGGDIGSSSFDLYDSDVKGGSFKSLVMNGKYSGMEADKAGDLKIDDTYDCSLKIDYVGDFTCQKSKYDDIWFGTVSKSIAMPDAYDIQMKVENLPVTFSGLTGDFKYGTITLKADPELDYKLSCQQTYGSLTYPQERFTGRPLTYIEKNSKTEFESSTSPDAGCEISFTGYDLNFTIK